MVLDVVLYAVLIPCGVEAIILLTAWLTTGLSARLAWAGALATGLAYAAGHLGQYRQWPPSLSDAGNWLFYAALACAAVGILEGLLSRTPAPLAILLRVIVAVASLWLILSPKRNNEWHGAETSLWIGGLGIALTLLWFSWDRLAKQLTDRAATSAMLLAVLGASAAITLSGAAKFGLLEGVLGATAGVIFVFSFIDSQTGFSRGMINVAAPVSFLLGVESYFYAELPWQSGTLLFVAPFIAWLAEIERIRKWSPWKVWLVRLMAMSIFIGAALAIAYAKSPQPANYGEDE
jgi:hypothetical protein